MKILISGTGIAGPSVAFFLSKLGHQVTIVERFAALRTSGLQVDLRGHGIDVLKRMGMEEAFRASSAPEQGLQVVNKSGKRKAFFPANKSGQGAQNFTSDFEIMRRDLSGLLYDATRDKVKYIFGNSIDSFQDKDDALHVRFEDGQTSEFDLLIGADGLRSRTRKILLGPNAPDPFRRLKSREYVGYFTIPLPITKGEGYLATMYFGTEQRIMMTRRHSPDEIQVYLGYSENSPRVKPFTPGNIQEEKEVLADFYRGAGWRTDEILSSLKDTDNFYGERMGLIKLDSWSKGRVVLLGDAAYCPSAKTGMGTTCAFVGAYILAGEIGKHCGTDADKFRLRAALEAYESNFRPFMDQVQKGIEEDEGGGIPSSAFGIAMLNLFTSVAAFFKINIAKMMMRENVKNWDLPEYKEITQK